MFRTFLLCSCIALTGACSMTQAPRHAELDTSYQLRVQQAFENLPNGTHLDFQQGRRVQPGNLDRWTTYCRLYLYDHTRDANYRTALLPGSFQVSAVDVGYRASDDPDYGARLIYSGVENMPAYYLYRVRMRLTSPDQPDVRSLNCYKKWATAYANQYPTLAEIRTALGERFELDAAAQ